MLDAPHMIKLIRNWFAKHRVFFLSCMITDIFSREQLNELLGDAMTDEMWDHEAARELPPAIEWRFIVNLVEIQAKHGLTLGGNFF